MAQDGYASKGTQRALIGAGIAAATAGAAAMFLWNRKLNQDHDDDLISDAPSWTLKKAPEGGEGAPIGRTVTIGRPAQELYDEWRDFTRFPRFMENVERVEKLDGKRSQWTIKAPAGSTIELVTEITAEEPGRRIAWKSTPDSQISTTGEVVFKTAPGDRGTYVSLVQTYDAPGGAIGKLFAKILQREPGIQARRDLRRFKQLMETGEVTTNASPSGRKSENPARAHI